MIVSASLNQPPDCDCAALVGCLGPDARLPDHVCRKTAFIASSNWLASTWPDDVIPVREGTKSILYPVGPGLLVVARHLHDWPYRLKYDAGRVYLVVRQWVEDNPSDALVRMLERNPKWRVLVGKLAEMPKERERAKEALDRIGACALENRVAEAGLPASPSTSRYLLHRANGGTPDTAHVLPARALLVTTLCIVPEEDGKPVSRSAAETFVTVHGSTTHATSRLFEKAGRLSKLHTSHWRKHWSPTKVLVGDLRAANSGTKDTKLGELVTAVNKGRLKPEQAIANRLKQKKDDLGRDLTPTETLRMISSTTRAVQRGRSNRQRNDDIDST